VSKVFESHPRILPQ